MRPPFTTNFKHNLPVVIASFDLTDYPANSFSSFKPVKQLINEGVDEANLPDPLQLIGKYTWDSDTLALLQKDVPEGSRSSALMRVGYKCAELGLSATEAYSIILHLDDRLGKFVHRNDRKKRLLDIVNKALQKYPHKLEEFTAKGLLGAPVAEITRYVFGFKDFMQADFRVDWAIRNLMPMGGCGLIVSPPNVGKTQFVTQLAIHQALGRDFVGYEFESKKRKGLFFSLEMGPTGYFQLLSSVAKDYEDVQDLLQEKMIIIPLGEPMPLAKLEAANLFFEKLIEEHRPDWIAIDSMQKVFTGKLTDDEPIRAFFNYLSSIRQRYNLYVWIVHHSRKAQGDNKKPNILSDVYGSMYITAEPDVVLSLWEDSPGSGLITLSQLKNRYAEIAKPFKIRRTQNLNFEIVDETTTFKGLTKDATPLGVVPANSSGEDRKTPVKFGFTV